MRYRVASFARVFPLALVLAASSLKAQQQQANSPIDDLLRRAGDAFNDLNYARADSLARQVLAIGSRLTTAQRTRALVVIAAAYYPEEKAQQKPALAMATLKQIFRTNLGLKIPQEMTWPGLDSLAEVARKNTFGMELTAEAQQVVVGEGQAKVGVRSNRPAQFRYTLLPASGPAVALDSSATTTTGEFSFPTMQNGKPVFTTGNYELVVTGVDAETRDTITLTHAIKVEAPPLEFVQTARELDSSKLLKERTGKYGVKSIIPAILLGGATFAFASTLRAQGVVKDSVGADTKGLGVAAGLALTTIVAGFLDKGRPIPANIAANKAYVAAFQKSLQDADVENKRRIAEYKTTLRIELEGK